ncbi:MAG: hypothetical protein J7518_08715 [Nocardioidaceae bacterium]|nr:hypothetical protein [Nocardioidaceae bacterium]
MNADRIRSIWETEIDRLELEVIRIERLLRGLHAAPAEPWQPPAVPEPIPADLLARATDLLDRQEIARTALKDALAEAQKQVAYADRVAQVTGRSLTEPVYLDLEA